MTSTDRRDAAQVGTLIVGAMLTGVIIFAVVVGVVIGPPPGPITPFAQWPSQLKLLSAICLMQMLAVLPMAFVLKAVAYRQGRNPATGHVPDNVRFTALIIQAALFESFGLFGLVICLVTRTWIPGGVFAAISIALLASLLIGSLRARAAPRNPYAPTETWQPPR